jgi:hypothetical protein
MTVDGTGMYGISREKPGIQRTKYVVALASLAAKAAATTKATTISVATTEVAAVATCNSNYRGNSSSTSIISILPSPLFSLPLFLSFSLSLSPSRFSSLPLSPSLSMRASSYSSLIALYPFRCRPILGFYAARKNAATA